jgi:RNA polymerase sigma factor (TIGR02999 family)
MGVSEPSVVARETQITELLASLRAGEAGAMERLFPLVYDELHDLARRQVKRMGPGQTLDTTALLHEAYLELCDRSEASWNDRTHFIAVAATVMRHLLIDRAREKSALKRGGGIKRVALEGLSSRAIGAPIEDLLDLAQALDRLATVDERLVRLVEMRFFGGLTATEVAEVLGISERTVKRDWRKAKALLYQLLAADSAA